MIFNYLCHKLLRTFLVAVICKSRQNKISEVAFMTFSRALTSRPELQSLFLQLVEDLGINFEQVWLGAIKSLLCNFRRLCYITNFKEVDINFGYMSTSSTYSKIRPGFLKFIMRIADIINEQHDIYFDLWLLQMRNNSSWLDYILSDHLWAGSPVRQ